MKKDVARTTKTVLKYIQATTKHLVPVAEFAAMFSGIPNAGGALKALTKLNPQEKGKTTVELRKAIAEKIVELNLSFIVLLDDLDRLEPAQAVEVIRLVKSVANFPHFRYLLCYDRPVLAHAIQNGLGVADGDLYLQKIVQITFNMPHPESLVFRREFSAGVIRLYQDVNTADPDKNIRDDLSWVTDNYGALKTPREVQMVLNGLDFRYSGIRDYIYLPDLCFLLLIHTTNITLYNWIEEYLTALSVVESQDGVVNEETQKALIQTFWESLSKFRLSKLESITLLQQIIPGISGYTFEDLRLFNQTSDYEKAEMTDKRRLGSNAYWRYYFAFSSPQNVLPPEYFNDLFNMAGSQEKHPALAKELLSKISSKGISSRTWFEHILTQLTWPMINMRTATECAGLLTLFFDYGDEVIARYRKRNRWFSQYNLGINQVASSLLKKMLDDDRKKAMEVLLSLVMDGASQFWIANYISALLWQNGLVGNRRVLEQDRVLTNEELERVRCHFHERIDKEDIVSLLQQSDFLREFVGAWQDIVGKDALKSLVTQYCVDDGAFLMLLISLRSRAISNGTEHLELRLREIAYLFEGEEALKKRLERIQAEGDFPEQIKEIYRLIDLDS